MVQILESNDALSQFNKGISTLPDALSQFMQRKRGDKQFSDEHTALKKLGYDIPKEIENPRIRESLFGEQKQKRKTEAQNLAEQKKLDVISRQFGPEAAELYPLLTGGGKTKLFTKLLDGKLKGVDSKQILLEQIINNPEDFELPDTEEMRAENPLTEKSFAKGAPSKTSRGIFQPATPSEEEESEQLSDIPEYKLDTEGRSGKALFDYQKELRGYNDEIYQDSIKSKRATDKSLRSLNDLKKLSPKLPSGLSRFFFDKEGNIRPLAQTLQLVPAEVEEYVKIVNDFTTQAKDSYGARVTNFELDRFLKRLPTAINSEKGRELIIKRMKNIAEVDRIRDQTLQEVYRKNGLGKITPEDADRIVEDVTEKRIGKMLQEADEIDEELDDFESGKTNKEKSKKKSLKEIFG